MAVTARRSQGRRAAQNPAYRLASQLIQAVVVALRARERDELVDTDEGGYRLTALGRDMVEAFAPLSKWAVRWWKTRV